MHEVNYNKERARVSDEMEHTRELNAISLCLLIVRLTLLMENIEIMYDDRCVPYIYIGNVEDVFFSKALWFCVHHRVLVLN